MGCITSKQARRDLRRGATTLNRRLSPPHHPKAGGACPSTDLACLVYSTTSVPTNDRCKGLSPDLVDAEAWSAMIEKRILKMPSETPPRCDIMRSLPPSPATLDRHSSRGTQDDEPVLESKLGSKRSSGAASPSATGTLQRSGEPLITAADFDPEMISNFREAPEEPLSPVSVDVASKRKSQRTESIGIVRVRRIDAKKGASADATTGICDFRRKCPPSGEGKVVLYFTSLRGVRKTYEECFSVRTILRGYEVRVDERDVSMDRRLRDELTEILGTEYGGSRLPRVFANGRDLGGAEEVKWMHEAGELGEALGDCEEAFVGEKGWGRPCEGCGDARFVLCGHCSGSRKVYFEEEAELGDVNVEIGFRRCPDCNENGIVRCSVCY